MLIKESNKTLKNSKKSGEAVNHLTSIFCLDC